jgi:biotin carboxylase
MRRQSVRHMRPCVAGGVREQVVKEEDVPKAAAHVGFPAVIKPISGAASIGVIRANNEEDLLKAFKK